MKHASSNLKSLWCLVLFGLLFPLELIGQTPKSEWKQIEEFIAKERPQSALKLLRNVELRAKQQKDQPKWLLAFATRLWLENQDDPLQKIQNGKEALTTTTPETSALLHIAIASWMQELLDQGKRRIPEQNGEPQDAPMEKWDLLRWRAEIDRHLALARQPGTELKEARLHDWQPIVSKSDLPEEYEPTLFDLVMNELVEAITSAPSYGKNLPTFTLESPLFGDTTTFLQWQVPAEIATTATGRILGLFKDWLQFHKDRNNLTALIFTDLYRLSWAQGYIPDRYEENAGQEPTPHSACLASLRQSFAKLLEAAGDREVAMPVRIGLGKISPNRQHRDLLHGGLEKHPKTAFSAYAKAQIRKLEATELGISTRQNWNPAGSEILVHAKNVAQVWFRIVPLSTPFRMEDKVHYLKKLPSQLARQKPIREWSVGVDNHDDLEEHRVWMQGPVDLPPGMYGLLSCNSPGFTPNGHKLCLNYICISNLAVVQRITTQGLEVCVVNALTGDPVPGAEVSRWAVAKWFDRGVLEQSRTDSSGLVRLKRMNEKTILVVRVGSEALTEEAATGYGERTEKVATPQTAVFTDRGIYRPGQTVFYKAVHYLMNGESDTFRVLPDVPRKIELEGVNGEQIEVQTKTTNDFGSCSGSFTLPTNGGRGLYSIDDEGGSAHIRVEEYKRPKFEVTFLPIVGMPVLGAKLQFRASVRTYIGTPVGGVHFDWKLEDNSEQKSPHRTGTGTTTADGLAHFEFTPGEPKSGRGRYNVTLTVTDQSGETRLASKNFHLDRTPYRVEIIASHLASEERPTELRVTTASTHDTVEPVSVQGELTLYSLVEPDHLTVKRPSLDYDSNDDAIPIGWQHWKSANIITTLPVSTDRMGGASLQVKLAAGVYRAIYKGTGLHAEEPSAQTEFVVIDPKATLFGHPLSFHTEVNQESITPGQTLRVLWASGYKKARAHVLVEARNGIVFQGWTAPDTTQQVMEFPIKDAHRGGLRVRIWQHCQHQFSSSTHHISVPWDDKQLQMKWTRFSSKLDAGAADTWKLRISGIAAEDAAVELLAGLRDASLDVLAEPNFPNFISTFPKLGSADGWEQSAIRAEGTSEQSRSKSKLNENASYPARSRLEIFGFYGRGYGFVSHLATTFGSKRKIELRAPLQDGQGNEKQPTHSVNPRRDLRETAFFLPHVITNAAGEAEFSFTMPETLTRWRFFGFAHDKALRSATMEAEMTTSRPIMVQPNAPRFLREGDTVDFPVKVINQSDVDQKGTVRLSFRSAADESDASDQLKMTEREQAFSIPSGQAVTLFWRITIPDGQPYLIWTATADSGHHADGEENFLPILPRRVPLQDSLVMNVRDDGRSDFLLASLKESRGNPSIRQESLTLNVTTHPAWEAVLALPYLMEYPHECSEQTFNRYYANMMVERILLSDPFLENVFKSWRNQPNADFKNPLERNPELKLTALMETPWLLEAKSDSARRHQLGTLFEEDRLTAERQRLADLLMSRSSEAGWPWFPGGPPDAFISLYIMAGVGKLEELGLEPSLRLRDRACKTADAWILKTHQEIPRKKRTEANFGHMAALYLYGRSKLLVKVPLEKEEKAALDYFKDQAAKYWMDQPILTQSQAALALLKLGNKKAAEEIATSLKERAHVDPTIGMSWPRNSPYFWFGAPIEAQSVVIELFHRLGDAKVVNDCQTWLLNQKRGQQWSSTKSTADACHAILLANTQLLDGGTLLEVKLGDELITPKELESGIGRYSVVIPGAEVTADKGNVTVFKNSPGPAWASLHWQYFADSSTAKPTEGNPLRIEKTLFRKAPDGTLSPAATTAEVGDEWVVRLTIICDENLEYVYLADPHAACAEPVNVLSSSKRNGTLTYYESTRDTATHFFIDALPKGRHVIEHHCRVQLRGKCQIAPAEIQCLYAPEFSARSAGGQVELK